MNNKILAALALTTALVTGLQAQCQINSGAYVGLSAGGAHLAGKNEFTTFNDVINQADKFNIKLSKTSIAASLFGGYGMKLSSFWVAAELFYQFDQLKDSTDDFTLQGNGGKKLESKSDGTYGAAAHLGFIPNGNCVVYAILGVEARRFKVNFADTDDNRINAKINKSYTSTAFAPGIGIRIAISKNISVRTEYKCAIHRKKEFQDTQPNPVGGNDTVKIKQSPTVHSFNVGLVYSF
jgi:outer membrane autotransporter protein